MKYYFLGALLFAGLIMATVLAFSSPVYANCGWCPGGSHNSSHNHSDDDAYHCGWCDSHSDHDCSMTDKSWDLWADNFKCPQSAKDTGHECSDNCRMHYMNESFNNCPSNDDPQFECDNDCIDRKSVV